MSPVWRRAYPLGIAFLLKIYTSLSRVTISTRRKIPRILVL